MPSGPSVMVLPGPQKNFDQFQADQASCQQYAQASIGASAQQNATNAAVGSAAVGSLLGAAAGAIIGSATGQAGPGAAIGAGTGLLFGSAAGSNAYGYSYYEAQRRYDMAYAQCMYARGNQLPGRVAYRAPSRPSAPAYPPPDYPPPALGNSTPPPGTDAPRPAASAPPGTAFRRVRSRQGPPRPSRRRPTTRRRATRRRTSRRRRVSRRKRLVETGRAAARISLSCLSRAPVCSPCSRVAWKPTCRPALHRDLQVVLVGREIDRIAVDVRRERRRAARARIRGAIFSSG